MHCGQNEYASLPPMTCSRQGAESIQVTAVFTGRLTFLARGRASNSNCQKHENRTDGNLSEQAR